MIHSFDTEDACDTSPVIDAGNPKLSGILAQGLDGSIYGTTPGRRRLRIQRRHLSRRINPLTLSILW